MVTNPIRPCALSGSLNIQNYMYIVMLRIVGCLTSDLKYFMHILKENKFNNIKKLQTNERGLGQLGKQLLTATSKVWSFFFLPF